MGVNGKAVYSCWFIQIPQCFTAGQIPCDTVIYHGPVEHWRLTRVSVSGLLTENVGSVSLSLSLSLCFSLCLCLSLALSRFLSVYLSLSHLN